MENLLHYRMDTESIQPEHGRYVITGRDAASITRSVERGVVSGRLRPGDALPSVRRLAATLGVSPSTVASAYRDLRRRGVLVTHDRARTVVGHRPPLAVRLAPTIPDGAVDLASGNPDPRLLPDLAPAVAALPATHHQYGDAITVAELTDLATSWFESDGIDATSLAVVSGGLDGIERVLQVHLRPGDRVAVEDPGYAGCLDLIRTLGFHPVGVEVDDAGMRPDALAAALRRGVEAVLHTPRAQNPTGAALTAERADALGVTLGHYPEVLLVEDDHAAPISGTDWHGVHRSQHRHAVVRSVAKWLGPGLRLAVVAGDEDTITRVLGRQRLGTGWVPQLLQHLVAEVAGRAAHDGVLSTAVTTYDRRRRGLIDTLAAEGITAHGATGLNVWIPVAEEVPVVQGLAERGWAVQAGEPYRIDSGPAIRVTTAALDDAAAFTDDLVDVLELRLGTRRG